MLNDDFDIEDVETSNRPWQEGDGIMATIDLTGDTKFVWNPEDEKEVKQARDLFDAQRAAGMLAYKVEGPEDARSRTQLTEFDPKAARLIFAPPPVGG